SLRDEPGCEIKAKIVERRCVTTPFPVEFARYSCSRGEAPTLVPVDSGGTKVKAEVLVLDDSVTLEAAKSILWRRETHKTNRAARYKRPNQPGPNNVLIEKLRDFEGFERVIYTDFAPLGKIADPNSTELAEKAIESVAKAKPGQDGITYLMNAKKMGVVTPLISAYESKILRLTCTKTLDEALQCAHNDLSSASV
ncbi:hypothetical protein KA005_20865, partial [bacterium]|nr:hypothetical protein [bacterium]